MLERRLSSYSSITNRETEMLPGVCGGINSLAKLEKHNHILKSIPRVRSASHIILPINFVDLSINFS